MSCEMPSVYGCDRRKARKAHKCCECRGVIVSGERYVVHHGVWDGSGATYKSCEDCELLREQVEGCITNPDERAGFGFLHESIFESDAETIARYLEIKRKRGGVIPAWMIKREKEFENELAKTKEQIANAKKEIKT